MLYFILYLYIIIIIKRNIILNLYIYRYIIKLSFIISIFIKKIEDNKEN